MATPLKCVPPSQRVHGKKTISLCNRHRQTKNHPLLSLPNWRGKKFRIRKLTPRECFRLMGVDDKDIDKIQDSGISNSAQYKLAGNSIVVDVLFHLFRKMFIETGPEDGVGEQRLF